PGIIGEAPVEHRWVRTEVNFQWRLVPLRSRAEVNVLELHLLRLKRCACDETVMHRRAPETLKVCCRWDRRCRFAFPFRRWRRRRLLLQLPLPVGPHNVVGLGLALR